MEYFSVGKQSDTIEYMSSDRLLDFSGWELRKTLQLLSKTNPNLSDWLLTDQIYICDDEFLKIIQDAQAKFYNPVHAMYHFFNIAKRHDEGYLRRNGCTLKKIVTSQPLKSVSREVGHWQRRDRDQRCLVLLSQVCITYGLNKNFDGYDSHNAQRPAPLEKHKKKAHRPLEVECGSRKHNIDGVSEKTLVKVA